MDGTAVELPFADGDHVFFLPMARLIAAEREMECSIFELYHHLGENLGKVGQEIVLAGPSPAGLKQCRALLRNALIGGGLAEGEARELVETYCFPARPAIYDLALSFEVLKTIIYGVKLEGEGSKKKGVEASEPPRSEKAP